MTRVRLPVEWTVGSTPDPTQPPTRCVAAAVPGAVQLDWARAEGWPAYWQAENVRAYAGMEDQYWLYTTRCPAAPLQPGERLFFTCGGVDYRCEVRIDGQRVHEQEGMFTAFELDCTTYADTGAQLQVLVFPAPKRHATPADRSQASASVKPPVSYGWDWHPRLIPLGIWGATHFEVRPAAHLRDAELRYTLAADHSRADLRMAVAASTDANGARVRCRLLAPDGSPVVVETAQIRNGSVTIEALLSRPALWWPHGHGEPVLYQFEATLLDADGKVLDTLGHRVGFRRVRLVMHPGAWEEPAQFPKSRSQPPITLEINGRAIFGKGSNWVNPEIFPGLCTADTYRPLLQLAQAAHFNLLRCWGGAPVNQEAFYDQCDELGLLVWQEFPLACNLYPDDPPYLQVLDRESRSIITRLRRHASLALWGGGNELFNAWSGMTDQSLPLRLLNHHCYELDPHTPFIPTAPLEGMAHGDYRFRDEAGREVHQIYPASAATAYSEFGCPGPSPVTYLRTFIPPEELWPPRRGTSWETHHAFDAWLPDTWLCLDVQRHYFGDPKSLEELVSRGEWLQTAGYQFIYEEARRQQPRCAMALNWCLNEPWPSAANNSLINWPAKPKPAYHAVAAACRPVLASARVPQFSWSPGGQFRAELWLLNDSTEALAAGRMHALLHWDGERLPLLSWDFPGAAAQQNLPGPEVRLRLPMRAESDAFELELTVEDQPEWGTRYRLHLRSSDWNERQPISTSTRTMNT